MKASDDDDDDSLCEFSLQISSGGEVSLFFGGCVTLISNLFARGERV
jgi:hypothetical protein